jgi:Predicted spermidine synthase with an N-terminal membrane domain
VHPAMSLATHHRDVLVLGGGDGLAVREVLKYPDLEAVTLVDLDPMVTELFRTHPDLVRLNNNALNDPRVQVVNKDAWRYVEEDAGQYDVIIIDLPDPDTYAVSKLYSQEFYAVLVQHLNLGGTMVTQATSPVFARDAFWSIHNTMAAAPNPYNAGEPLNLIPYHVYVPSFGDWGFVMASAHNMSQRGIIEDVERRFLSAERWQAAQVFAPDIGSTEAEQNTIQTHAVVSYYLEGWSRWFNLTPLSSA